MVRGGYGWLRREEQGIVGKSREGEGKSREREKGEDGQMEKVA